MPVTTSYPGVYIEELPSFAHSVTAAPTSDTVFIGYSHPFRTGKDSNGNPLFGTATQIFSFAEYQANFGGFFAFDPWLPDYLGNAVFQFFQNGGAVAWIVALQATNYIDTSGKVKQPQPLAAATVDLPMGAANANPMPTVTLSAQQLGAVVPGTGGATNTEIGIGTSVQVANVRNDAKGNANAVADLIITFGTQVETYRGVNAGDIQNQLAPSALVGVSNIANGPPTQFSPGPYPLVFAKAPPDPSTWTLINPADYGNVFLQGASLDVDVPIFNLMVLPGISPVNDPQNFLLSQAMVYCEQKRAFFIMDAPPNATTSGSPPGPAPLDNPAGTPTAVIMDQFWRGNTTQTAPPVNTNGAIYFPYVRTIDPLTQNEIYSPPSGLVAGIFAREDVAYSVGKAPAGLETTIVGSLGVVPWGRMTDMHQGVLNLDGVNCLRDFPGIGTVVYGARTLVSDNPAFEQWKYVPVRRTALFLEQSLYQSLTWAVFQENAEPLWNALTQEINAFMLTLFKQGTYFKGTTPSQAFLVQCDSTTTTQADIDAGNVNILVGFAPLKPAEFVIVQITQLAGQTQT